MLLGGYCNADVSNVRIHHWSDQDCTDDFNMEWFKWDKITINYNMTTYMTAATATYNIVVFMVILVVLVVVVAQLQ